MSNQGPIGFGDPNDEELPTFAGMPGDPPDRRESRPTTP